MQDSTWSYCCYFLLLQYSTAAGTAGGAAAGAYGGTAAGAYGIFDTDAYGYGAAAIDAATDIILSVYCSCFAIVLLLFVAIMST